MKICFDKLGKHFAKCEINPAKIVQKFKFVYAQYSVKSGHKTCSFGFATGRV